MANWTPRESVIVPLGAATTSWVTCWVAAACCSEPARKAPRYVARATATASRTTNARKRIPIRRSTAATDGYPPLVCCTAAAPVTTAVDVAAYPAGGSEARN